MSDWDFLHDMHNEGYSAQDISDAAGVGYAPWQAKYINFGDDVSNKQVRTSNLNQKKKSPVAPSNQIEVALQGLERLRQSQVLTRAQFLACKQVIISKNSQP